MVLDNATNKENNPLQTKRSTSSGFSDASTKDDLDNTTNSRKSGQRGQTTQPTSSFKMGNFTKSLFAKAHSDDSCLSPGTLQNLVNPMRSQLGLPQLSLFQRSPESTTAELPSGADKTDNELLIQSTDAIVACSNDKNDSGVDSNSDSKNDDGEGQSSVLNTSSQETDDLNSAVRRLALNESSDNSISTTLTEGRNSRMDASEHHSVVKSHTQFAHHPAPHQYSTFTQPVPSSALTKSTKSHFNQSTEMPKFMHSNMNKKSSLATPGRKSSIGCGSNIDNNNYSNNIPEVSIAAVIPTPRTKTKVKVSNGNVVCETGDGNPNKKFSNTPRANAGHGHNVKQKNLPVLKEKKHSTSVGWKFSSDHVQGKEYLIIKQLGKGGCGEVLLVIEKDTRELFALKRVNLSGIADASIDECVNEVQMLVDLRDSDLVVHIYAWEFDKSEKTMKILMEHGQCDLQHSVKANNWTSLKLKCVWERLLTIVDFIHRRGIVHADLKPANFIWAGDNLKIIDFGIASRLQQDHTSIAMLCPKGTLNFISPETIQPDALGLAKISPKSDIWSLGCILYLMVYGRTPFEHIGHPVQKMTAICKGTIEYPPVPSQLNASAFEIISVLKLCFQMDYRQRPTTSDLLQHSMIKNVLSL